jgi:hypothetical protein
MHCQESQKRTSEYIDHLLGEVDRSAYVDHLAACAPCRAHLGEMRGTVEWLRSLPAIPPPPDLYESTFRAIDRTEEPRLAVVATPPRRRLRPMDAGLGALVRRFFVEHEFHLIAYSVGMVASFFLFTGVLMGLRPLVALTAGQSPRQATIWITTREADAMGVDLEPRLAAVAYTIPKVSEQGGLPQFAARSQASGSDLIVLADVSAEGRASIVEILGGTADPQVVGELAIALNRRVFVPARAISGRPVASRVVFLLQRVDVVG